LSPARQDAVRKGVLIGVRDALARLRSDVDVVDELPPDLATLARLWADCSEEPDVAEVWLVGQDAFWDSFAMMAERVLNDTARCWDVVKDARGQLNGHTARLYELIRRTREEELASADRLNGFRLDGLWRALRGDWVDADDLGYDLANSHIALIAETSTSLDGLAQRTGRELLKVPAPGGGVWGWLGGLPRLSDSELDELLAWQRCREGRVAAGEPAEGIGGFSMSHDQALEASSIAIATDEPVVRFADVQLLAAVLRDNELAKGFVERELGELNKPSERMFELRATLRVYLEQGQNVSATAALRRRDRKTILRQLRSAEELIRHNVHNRSDELSIALRAADILRRANGSGAW
jgi:hypothetical protein